MNHKEGKRKPKRVCVGREMEKRGKECDTLCVGWGESLEKMGEDKTLEIKKKLRKEKSVTLCVLAGEGVAKGEQDRLARLPARN